MSVPDSAPRTRTIFERIADHEIPSTIVYEDDYVVALRDANAQAPTHILVVPRRPIARIDAATKDDQALLGHLLLKAAHVARQLHLDATGYRLVINNGRDGGESVPHLHVHLLGGRPMAWPPG